MVADAVSIEPVSYPNSLLTGKFTGNFVEGERPGRLQPPGAPGSDRRVFGVSGFRSWDGRRTPALLRSKGEDLVLAGPFGWQVGEAGNSHPMQEPPVDGGRSTRSLLTPVRKAVVGYQHPLAVYEDLMPGGAA